MIKKFLFIVKKKITVVLHFFSVSKKNKALSLMAVLQKIPDLPITDEDDVTNKEEAKKLLEEISK